MSAPRGRRAAERLAPERSTTSRGTVLVSLGAVVVCLLGLVGAGLSGRPTGVSAPVAATASMSCCGPACSHAISLSRPAGGLPPSTVRGSMKSIDCSATIWAHQRSPRPTWRINCSNVHSGQVGTGIDRSASRRRSASAAFSASRAGAKSTKKTYVNAGRPKA